MMGDNLPEGRCEAPRDHTPHAVLVGRRQYRCTGGPLPAAPPAWDPDVEAWLEQAGELLAQGLLPLAAALQHARAGTAVLLERYTAVYDALAATVDLLDRGSIQPGIPGRHPARANWATDQEILDTARAVVARLSPTTNGTPDADT